MVILSCYDKKFSICGEKQKTKSIVQPGQALPMNKLIKGVINGTIVINSVPAEYDFGVKEVEVQEGNTPSSTFAAVNEAFVNELQQQSSDFSNPTVAPGFDINEAENIINRIESTASSGEKGGRADVAESAALHQKAGSDEAKQQPSESLSDEAVVS